jgi:polyketide synthase 5
MTAVDAGENLLNGSGKAVSPRSGSTATVTPIAVIGMACRLPGAIDSPERLWQALLRGDDLVTEIPADRWDADDYYDPEPGVPGRSVSKWGAFLDDVAGFDSEFFGMGDREATVSDPQHRLLLETSWEAMEHAGLNREMLTDTRTGVFLGLTHTDYQLLAADAGAVLAWPPCTWPAAVCTRAKVTSRWPAASRWHWIRASGPPGRRRECCLRPEPAMPSTSKRTASWQARAAQS